MHRAKTRRATQGRTLGKQSRTVPAIPAERVQKPVEIQVEQVIPSVIGYGSPPPQAKSFAASTAGSTGMTKQSINRH